MFIYLVVNHITGKYYVGQHRGNNLKKYLQQKLSQAWYELKRKGKGGGSHLFASMRKHPKEVFSIHALLSDIQTKEELDQKEMDFIEFLRSRDPEYGYNICKGGEGFTGPQSKEARKKIGIASKQVWDNDPQRRTNMITKMTGRIFSDESIARMKNSPKSATQLGCLTTGRPSATDMTGQVINGIRVLQRAKRLNAKETGAYWSCQCHCGETFVVLGYSLRKSHTQSCGCLKNKYGFGVNHG